MIGVLIITFVALLISVILVVVDNYINKKEDNSQKFLELLPGYNCGACGFGGCQGMSEAMCKDTLNYKKCKPLRGDKLAKMEEYINSLK